MGKVPTRLLTIGCSCINRFQFDFFQARHPATAPQFVRSLFDWNITSLVGTRAVLQHAVAGTLQDAIEAKSDYAVQWDVLLFHKRLPGLCLFHEQDIAESFEEPSQKDILVSKLTHQAAPFLAPSYAGRTHLFWSNIQPNLPDTVENVTPWADFQLTEPHYESVTQLAKNLFGPDTTLSFLSLAEDVAPDLHGLRDVHVINLPRGPEYEGPPDLYDSILQDILLTSHS